MAAPLASEGYWEGGEASAKVRPASWPCGRRRARALTTSGAAGGREAALRRCGATPAFAHTHTRPLALAGSARALRQAAEPEVAAEVRDAHERVLASTGVGAGPSVTVADRGLLNACKARARTAGAHGPEGGLCSQALQAARPQSVAAALKAGANPKLGLSFMFKVVGLIDPEPAAAIVRLLKAADGPSFE